MGFNSKARSFPLTPKNGKNGLKSKYQPIANIENRKPGSGIAMAAAPHYFDDGSLNHDTMGTIAMDTKGGLAGMVTTSGMAFKDAAESEIRR